MTKCINCIFKWTLSCLQASYTYSISILRKKTAGLHELTLLAWLTHSFCVCACVRVRTCVWVVWPDSSCAVHRDYISKESKIHQTVPASIINQHTPQGYVYACMCVYVCEKYGTNRKRKETKKRERTSQRKVRGKRERERERERDSKRRTDSKEAR